MGITVILNPVITVGSVDLTNHIDTVTIEETYADIDTTSFGSGGSKTRTGGLGDHKVSLNFQQDFAASSVDATISPLVGLTTLVTFKPTSSATSTVNPAWSMTCLVTDYKPIDNKVGALSMSQVTWPVSGAVTRAVS